MGVGERSGTANRQRQSGDGQAEVDKFINDNNEDDEVDDNINN